MANSLTQFSETIALHMVTSLQSLLHATRMNIHGHRLELHSSFSYCPRLSYLYNHIAPEIAPHAIAKFSFINFHIGSPSL